VNGRWVALQRQEYNYFLADKGLGPIYGERVVSSGITPVAGRDIATGQQFAGH
jgi:hypothetical protein